MPACAFAVLVLLLAGVRWLAPAVLAGPIGEGGWTDRARAAFVPDGFYGTEIDTSSGRRFSWMSGQARLIWPRLDRAQAHVLGLAVSAGRTPEAPLPELRVFVDGALVATPLVGNPLQHVDVAIPARQAAGTTIDLVVSNTFVPGGGDDRRLGIVVDEVSLAPASGHFSVARDVLLTAAAAAAMGALALLLCGAGSRVVAGGGAAIALAIAWLLLQDGAFIGTYASLLVRVTGGGVVAGAVVGLARYACRRAPLWPEWPDAVAITLVAAMMQIALILHPLAMVGDGVFQVHRAQLVVAGSYFFTSVTPKPFFEFPYAIALYVAALPFWRFAPGVLDRLHLLRIVTIAANALVGLGLYAVVRRQWRWPAAGLLCAALWPLARAPMQAVCNANLTNVFAQAFFGVGVCALAWLAAGGGVSWSAAAIATACLAVGFLGHFGTITTGVPLLAAIAVCSWSTRSVALRRSCAWTAVVLAVATSIAVGVYYANPRFLPVYRDTLARVTSHAAPEGVSKMVATPATKLRRLGDETGDNYGLPGLVLGVCALGGAVILVRRRWQDALTRMLIGWALGWAGLTALGVLTPVVLRANLAAAPAFTALGAYLLVELARRSVAGTWVAGAAVVAIAVSGLRIWMSCLGV